MTALAIRQALATVTTTETADGTADNPVAKIYFYHDDQIAFSDFPVLIVASPDDDERPTTLSATHSESNIRVDIYYLDAPLEDDVQQEQMAIVEAWFEQAKANIRRNPKGRIDDVPTWRFVERMRTQIDAPLRDQGRVLYQGMLSVWIKSQLLS